MAYLLCLMVWLSAALIWQAPTHAGLAKSPLDAAKPLGLSLFQDKLLPADQAFRFYAEVESPTAVRLSWQIADGYYLYRDRFKVEKLSGEAELGALQLPPGERKQDPEFGLTEVYHQSVSAVLPLRRLSRTATELTLTVRYQGCAERGVCYPPQVQTARLMLPAIAASQPPPPRLALAKQDRIAQLFKDQSFWLTFVSFLGFGILLAFTPCCFPMLPILSGIIVGQGQKITTLRAFGLSMSYVLASALTYTVFGVLAGLFGANLQAAFQSTWAIVGVSALFVALALSMFGLYELQLPLSWQNRLHRLQPKRGGHFLNAAAMGMLSTLVVSPCVAAPLAGALIYIGQTGDAILGGAALFALGLGMGLPLVAVGTSAGKLLPKAGLWLNTVKAVFGVLLIGVAIWLLSRILPPSATLFLWALWLIVPAVYLGAASSLSPEAPHRQKLGKALGIAMLTYGILLLVGAALGSRSVFQPLEPLTAQKAPSTTAFSRPVSSTSALDSALQQASGKWVMLDFYADWCVSCQEMESQTLTDPKVKEALAKLSVLRADVTANTEAHQILMRRFNLIGPPAILFFDPQGQECQAARLIGYVPPEEFLTHLNELPERCG
ncbi:MAG: protein-disulfide reductase DsbD [Methylohalobius sp.]|nr:protein-disulfide reductase DsbD [Methylohalobius sp.]